MTVTTKVVLFIFSGLLGFIFVNEMRMYRKLDKVKFELGILERRCSYSEEIIGYLVGEETEFSIEQSNYRQYPKRKKTPKEFDSENF